MTEAIPDEAGAFVLRRERGIDEVDYLRHLPAAAHPCVPSIDVEARHAHARLGDGRVDWRWTPQPPRRLGLLRLPLMLEELSFTGVDEVTREAFIRSFDRYLHRGGG